MNPDRKIFRLNTDKPNTDNLLKELFLLTASATFILSACTTDREDNAPFFCVKEGSERIVRSLPFSVHDRKEVPGDGSPAVIMSCSDGGWYLSVAASSGIIYDHWLGDDLNESSVGKLFRRDEALCTDVTVSAEEEKTVCVERARQGAEPYIFF